MEKVYQLRTLSADEEAKLVRLEETISQGMLCFVEVGKALLEIRDERLYRQTHDTFQNYCTQKWGFGRSYADRLIAYTKVTDVLTPTGVKITSERQIRSLTHLQPEQQKEVWEKAVESAPDGKVTAKHVAEAVADMETPDEAVEVVEPGEAVPVPKAVQLATVKKLCRIFSAANEEDQLSFLQWTEINYKDLFAEAMWAD